MGKPIEIDEWYQRVDPFEMRMREIKQYRKLLIKNDYLSDDDLCHLLACDKDELRKIAIASNLIG